MGAKIYNTTYPAFDHCIGYVDDDGTIYSDSTKIVGNWIGFVDAETGKVYDTTTPKSDHCIGCATPEGKLYRDAVPIVGDDIGYINSSGTVFNEKGISIGNEIGFVEPTSMLAFGGACFFIRKGLLRSSQDGSGNAQAESAAHEQASYTPPNDNADSFQERYPETDSKPSFNMPTGGGGGGSILGEALVVVGIGIVGYLVYSLFSDPRALILTLACFGLAAGITWYFRLGVFKNRGSMDFSDTFGGFASKAKSGFDKARSAGSAAASKAASAARNAASQIPHPVDSPVNPAPNSQSGEYRQPAGTPVPPANGEVKVQKTIFGDMETISGPAADNMFQQFFGSQGMGGAPSNVQDSSGFVPYGENETHRFYRCTTCNGQMSIPKGVGTVMATCPKCGRRETVDTGKKPDEPKPSAQPAGSATVKFVCPVCSRAMSFPAHIGTISFKCPTCGTSHTFDTGESAL